MFDYFYGQSGEMFSYFRVPKILFRDIKFKDLSTDAKTLYGILLDRMGLSVKSRWPFTHTAIRMHYPGMRKRRKHLYRREDCKQNPVPPPKPLRSSRKDDRI